MMTPELTLALEKQLGAMPPNLRAWANMLGAAEGTRNSPITRNDGYDVIVNGLVGGRLVHEIFDDYAQHPFATGRVPKVVNSAGLRSTAAGKFQLLARYWSPYRVQLSLPDFGPASQIRIMAQQVKECRALDDILTGHLIVAIGKCCSRWASLPGNNYGQRQLRLGTLLAVYEREGGTLA